MEERMYGSSAFWEWSYHATDFAHLVWPALLAVIIVVLAWRTRTAWTALAVLGALLVVAGHVTHLARPKINIVAMGHPQPAEGMNALVVFLSLHALHLGMLIATLALFDQLLRRPRRA